MSVCENLLCFCVVVFVCLYAFVYLCLFACVSLCLHGSVGLLAGELRLGSVGV